MSDRIVDVDPRSVCGVLHQYLNDKFMTIRELEKRLAKEGLNVVTDLDMAVLKACSNLDQERLEHQQGNDGCYYSDELDLVDAELARRKAAK